MVDKTDANIKAISEKLDDINSVISYYYNEGHLTTNPEIRLCNSIDNYLTKIDDALQIIRSEAEIKRFD